MKNVLLLFVFITAFSLNAYTQSLHQDALKGDSNAQYELGYSYLFGEGLEKDEQTGFKWLLESAKQGISDAQYYVGWCYFNGVGVSKDAQLGFLWSLKAAEQGHADAQCIVGLCCFNENGASKDESQGYRWLLKSAEQGYALAEYYVGHCYMNGDGVLKDERQGFGWYMKAAEQGLADAQYWVGFCYMLGKGIHKNEYQGYQWFFKSAEQGNAISQRNVGHCYMDGTGVQKDERQGFQWYMKSAEQGLADAQCDIGLCYIEGKGVSKDERQGFQWYMKSAEQGLAEAQCSLGFCYMSGRGVSEDDHQGFQWYMKAAEQGLPEAQYRVGYCYMNSVGVSKDERQGFQWYMKAAEQGIPEAQYQVGLFFSKGKGVQQDYVQAVKWYSAAMAQNNAWAYNDMAYLYINGTGVVKNVQKAFEMIDNAIKIDPNNLNFYDTKGELYSIIGDKEKALEVWNFIIAKNIEFQKGDTPFVQYIRNIQSADVDMNIPFVSIENELTFVLVIANENYRREAKVPYAINDGKSFTAYCKQTLGIPENSIHFVADATLNDMKYHLNWLKQVIDIYGETSKVIVYYAGHGIPDEKNKSAYLLPIDGYGTDVDTGYSIKELYSTLGSLPAHSITIFLDACFSGAKREEGMLTVARGVAIKVKAAEPSGNLVVFSAAQGDETAYPYKEQQHGLFTYYLLKKLQETKGNVTLGELSDYVKDNVQKKSIVVNGKSQTPMVNVSSVLGDKWKSWPLNK